MRIGGFLSDLLPKTVKTHTVELYKKMRKYTSVLAQVCRRQPLVPQKLLSRALQDDISG